MKIGIDMMGGDFAPLEALNGIQQYLEEGKAHLVLIGDEEKIKAALSGNPLPTAAYTLVHAPQVIDMHEHPTKALKEKQQIFHRNRISIAGNRRYGCFYQRR